MKPNFNVIWHPSPAAQLTLFYVLILAVLCGVFSFALYSFADHQVVDIAIHEHHDLFRPSNGMVTPHLPEIGNESDHLIPAEVLPYIETGRHNLILKLLEFCGVVLALGTALSYWLARRTLRPIEAALEAQSRFTADASHELRTPLAVMQTEIEIARADPKLSRSQALELLDSNLEEVERLRALADGLLRLSRSESQPIKLRAVDTGSIAQAAIAAAGPVARAHEAVIVNDVRGFTGTGDEAMLVELVGIFLDNSIKYSPAGSTITVQDGRERGHAFLSVTDHGIGIAAEDLPHIFKRFYRSDKSRTRDEVEGHGLGLSLAQKIAEINGAELGVKSQVGTGSTFTLRLRAKT